MKIFFESDNNAGEPCLTCLSKKIIETESEIEKLEIKMLQTKYKIKRALKLIESLQFISYERGRT